MRAQRTGFSTYQLFDRGEEIGYIDGRRVGFTGFTSAADAGVAAWASAQELRLRRRGPDGRNAPTYVAKPLLIERDPDDLVLADCDIVADIKRTPGEPHLNTADSWGFEICSPSGDGPELLIVGQARIMWRAIRARRAHRLMEQFATPATV
jgi:hypothetical protein